MNLVIADATVEGNSKICNAEVQPGNAHTNATSSYDLRPITICNFITNHTPLGAAKIAFDYRSEMIEIYKNTKQARTILPSQTMYIVVASYHTT